VSLPIIYHYGFANGKDTGGSTGRDAFPPRHVPAAVPVAGASNHVLVAALAADLSASLCDA
jgi:hypothetical protein